MSVPDIVWVHPEVCDVIADRLDQLSGVVLQGQVGQGGHQGNLRWTVGTLGTEGLGYELDIWEEVLWRSVVVGVRGGVGGVGRDMGLTGVGYGNGVPLLPAMLTEKSCMQETLTLSTG